MQIGSKYQQKVTTQSYSGRPKIEGVELKQLEFHHDDGGNFCEVFRITEGQIEGLGQGFTIRQVSLSILTPGTIKAFHLHYQQEDLWFVPPNDRLLVNLVDLRQESPSYEVAHRLVLGGGKAQLLRIPAGVAHGVANVYERNMSMFYATSKQFNAQQPDEHRLPWDTFGAEIWQLSKG